MTVVLADVAVGIAPGVSAILFGLCIAIVVIEGAVLWIFRRKSIGRSLLHSLAMNVVSTVIGIVLAGFYSSLLNQEPPLGFVIFLIVTWASSVLIEAGVLLGLRWDNNRKTWQAVAVANILSYVLLGLVIAVSLI